MVTNTKFRTIDGRKVPFNEALKKGYTYSKQMTYDQVKKARIHGLFFTGYILDMADHERRKYLQKAIAKYGKSDVISELGNLRSLKSGDQRAERVIDSDLAYLATGKFQED